jgi:dTDP-4-amino-4,6-dideoxygalactose transaminase
MSQLRYSIPLARPAISESDIAAVVEVLRSGMLVQGPKVSAVEAALCHRTGAPFAAAAANGTATLHLALLTLGIGPGDEVIVPAFSYVATANAVIHAGATPVFVDIEEATFNIDVAKIEAAITPRTRAIMPVHEFGLCADMDAVMDLARQHQLLVIEDAACALGALDGGREAGTMGDAGSFSFHPRKAATSGEGGALLLKKEEHWLAARALRNHGIGQRLGDTSDDFIYAGYNFRLTDIAAALLLGQLERVDAARERRAELADRYNAAFSISGVIQPPVTPLGKRHAWQTYHVMLHPTLDRNRIIHGMASLGIGCSYGAQCIPALPIYREKYGFSLSKFPVSYRCFNDGLALPLYESLQNNEVDFVAQSLLRLTGIP